MKTTTDLFLAFTENRKPSVIRSNDDIHSNRKEYLLSVKQANWLSSLIFKKAYNVDKCGISITKQYQEKINGLTYQLSQGKKTNRILVSQS